MFSKFSSSLSLGGVLLQSPKQLLANYLSTYLAEFFDVNPKDVETNLLTNAKVALHNINIKNRRIGGSSGSEEEVNLVLHGSVKLIEFSWSWGSSTQNLITDVKLTIQGVDIHIIEEEYEEGYDDNKEGGDDLQKQQQSLSTAVSTTAVSTTTTPGGESGTSGGTGDNWKTRYLNQIIDCLTLIVKDVTIAIHMKEDDNSASGNENINRSSTSTIYLLGKDMEIHTTHRHHQQQQKTNQDQKTTTTTNDSNTSSPCLTQRLQMLSIEAWITTTTTTTTTITEQGQEEVVEEESRNNNDGGNKQQQRYQILDPFSYSATVQRVSGRRFVDGIMSGLFIQGDV